MLTASSSPQLTPAQPTSSTRTSRITSSTNASSSTTSTTSSNPGSRRSHHRQSMSSKASCIPYQKMTLRRSNGLLNLEECLDNPSTANTASCAGSSPPPLQTPNPLKRSANNSPLSELLRDSREKWYRSYSTSPTHHRSTGRSLNTGDGSDSICNDNGNSTSINSTNATATYSLFNHHLDPRSLDGHISPSPSPAKHAPRRLKTRMSAALEQEINSYCTPDSGYRSVKPLQMAFASQGLMSKRNRKSLTFVGTATPDTPCKRNIGSTTTSAVTPETAGDHNQETNFDSPSVHVHNKQVDSATSSRGRATSPVSFRYNNGSNNFSPFLINEHKVYRRSRLGLQDNMLRFNDHQSPVKAQVSTGASVMDNSTDSSSGNSLVMNGDDEDTQMTDVADVVEQPETPTRDAVRFEFGNSNNARHLAKFSINEERPKLGRFFTDQRPNQLKQLSSFNTFTNPVKVRALDFQTTNEFLDSKAFQDSFDSSSPFAHHETSLFDQQANDSLRFPPSMSFMNSPTPQQLPRSLSEASEQPSLTSSSSLSSASTSESLVSVSREPLARRIGGNVNAAISAFPQTPARSIRPRPDPAVATKYEMPSCEDQFLSSRFDKVSLIGQGEFSTVFVVASSTDPANKYAVKRTKYPFSGPRARQRRLEEVEILRDLNRRRQSTLSIKSMISPSDNDAHGTANTQLIGSDGVITLLDSWETYDHLYILTEFCDNGSLDTFLSDLGNVSRLDEWRVWKILVEVSLGLQYIHDSGFLHLDIKPANIFITFEGTLKIGDFGMATRYPASKGIEREGDREYIAPEVLSSQRYDKPADIFSLGIMMVEIAANIILPDNGIHWQKLRSGDLSDAGRLSSGDLANERAVQSRQNPSIPKWAPKFMIDESQALDQIVKWMLYPEPESRPTAAAILASEQVQWVETHRKAGAVIYEGDYGPRPDDDEEESAMAGQEMVNWQ